MSRALRPVPPDETQRMAAQLVQAVRADWSEDQLAALVDGYVQRMLDGRTRLASLTDLRAFTTSVAGMWLALAQIAALIGQPGTSSEGTDLALQVLALNLAG